MFLFLSLLIITLFLFRFFTQSFNDFKYFIFNFILKVFFFLKFLSFLQEVAKHLSESYGDRAVDVALLSEVSFLFSFFSLLSSSLSLF